MITTMILLILFCIATGLITLLLFEKSKRLKVRCTLLDKKLKNSLWIHADYIPSNKGNLVLTRCLNYSKQNRTKFYYMVGTVTEKEGRFMVTSFNDNVVLQQNILDFIMLEEAETMS